MDPEKLESLRARLSSLAESLKEVLRSRRDDTAPVSLDAPIGRLSRMGAIQSQQMALAVRERQREQLARVQRALDAIARGTYGECPRCGDAIAEERLEAQPDVVLCLACATGPRSGRQGGA